MEAVVHPFVVPHHLTANDPEDPAQGQVSASPAAPYTQGRKRS